MRRTVWGWIALGLILVAALAAGAWWAFAPKPEEPRADAAPPGASALSQGSFRDGAPLHTTSGTVTLLQDAEGYVLRFEGYDATPGPAVYFYLTRDGDAATMEAVEQNGIRLETSGMGGQATLRGDFNVRLPEDIDATAYRGLAAWCERYDVLFGSAALSAA